MRGHAVRGHAVRRWLRRLTWTLAGGVVIVALLLGGLSLAYPELTALTVHTLRHSSLGESRDLFAFILYVQRTMELLEPDPVTGAYSFDGVDVSRLDAFERGYVAFHRGDFTAAVRAFERAVEERGESEKRLFWLALAHLRRGEALNCLERLRHDTMGAAVSHAAGICALPLGSFHDRPQPSRRAAQLFERLLDRYDAADAVYRWLLNFSYMTVDGFPDEVPGRYRLPGDFVDRLYGTSEAELEALAGRLRFVDRAAELGVDRLDTGRGVAVEDFDRDGDLDLAVGGTFEDVRFYRNDVHVADPAPVADGPRGRFTDVTEAVGLGGVLQPFFVSAADFDDDGWVDLLVGRPFERFALFRNELGETGRFRDVTADSGLLREGDEERLASTWAIAWGDVDRDGDLDLFLTQWGVSFPSSSEYLSAPRMGSRLYLNDGGRFTDRTAEYGLEDVVRGAFLVGAAFGDVEGDGYPELMLSGWVRGTTVLLRNRQGRRFEASGLVDPLRPGFMTAFVDVDHDGRLDLFRGGYGIARTSIPRVLERALDPGLDRQEARRGSHRGTSSLIYVQTPDSRFEPREDYFAGRLPVGTMGASYGDLDNDGCLDFYLGTGSPEPWYVVPNLMYLGRREGWECRGGTVNVSGLAGFGTVQKGHGVVFFDFDGDGDQDVYSALGGMWPGDEWPNQLFVNEGQGRHRWVKLRLRGRQTNRYGVGARIRVVAVGPAGEPIVRTYHMDAKTGFGSAPYLAHVGLGEAVAVEEVEVEWPVSGCRASYQVELGRPGAPAQVLDEAACGPQRPSAYRDSLPK